MGVDVRDVEELKVVEAGNRSANCIYARVVFISFRYSGSERKERLVPFTGLRGADGKWGRRRCTTAIIKGQSGDQTCRVRWSFGSLGSLISHLYAMVEQKKKQIPCKRI